jgi:hypothetical protein
MADEDARKFRKGGIRRAIDESDISTAHDLIIIESLYESSSWPNPVKGILRQLLSIAPPPHFEPSDSEPPDIPASEVLEDLLHNLAVALQEDSSQ